MSRNPTYLTYREIPDEELVDKIKEMIKDGKSPKMMKRELSNVSLNVIRRYYTKIRKGIW